MDHHAGVPHFTSTRTGAADRGVEFGELFREEVATTVATYRALFDRRAGSRFDADLWGERAWETIRDHAPEAAEEIAGLAVGAGRPVREIAAINARTELLALADPAGPEECSAVVATPPGRIPLAAQTWDWCHAMADRWLHWRIPEADGGHVETVTEYGVLGKIGVSSRGVGVLLTILHHTNDDQRGRDDAQVGLPVHLVSRSILDHAGSTAEAVRLVEQARPSASTSLTVVDRWGDAASLELFPGGPGVLRPEDGLLVRTNHFATPAGVPGCLAERFGAGSRVRQRALRERLASSPPASLADVLGAMDHHDPDGAVCAHPDQAVEPLLRKATLATVGVDLERAALVVRRGGPCAASPQGPVEGSRLSPSGRR